MSAESLEGLLDAAPPPLVLDGAPARVREARARTGRRTVALDDDPTGSQSVHGCGW